MTESRAQRRTERQTVREVNRRRSRYDRPRRAISWGGLLVGLILGTVGGVYFAWNIAPIEEFDTAPWQLSQDDKARYLVALMLRYDYTGDLGQTVSALTELRLPGDPIQAVADIACQLARTGYVNSASGERGIRSMMKFYQLQGRTGCADQILPPLAPPPTVEVIVAATPTLPPPPTKTPTPPGEVRPTDTPQGRIVPTVPAQSAFRLARLESFCDADFGGVIEVYVQNSDGSGIPGQRVRVSWDGGESVFITGLKPERGLDYADFFMEVNRGYTIELPGRSDPSTQSIVSVPCVDTTGRQTQTSYRAVFRPSFGGF